MSPLCGAQAEADRFHTRAQLEFIQQAVAGPALEAVAEEVDRASREPEGSSYETNPGGRSDELLPMIEPDDTFAVESPCHA